MKIKFIQNLIDFLRGKYKNRVDWSREEDYEKNIEKAYKLYMGETLDLANPQTFSQKMQWLRIFDNSPMKTKLADKYLVRDWVKNTIGEEYLIPLLGVYDNFEQINFEELPDSFVIQCNHGCGYNIVVKNKAELDYEDARNKINQWMSENFAYRFGEWHYKDIKRKIIITQYIEELSGDISDYKFFCFNGKPWYILFCTDRASGVLKNSFFNMEWDNMNFNYTGELINFPVQKPQNFELMCELAEKLCDGFKHVRVDFYNINGKIYFGEMTFTSYAGYFKFKPEEWNLKLGQLLHIYN